MNDTLDLRPALRGLAVLLAAFGTSTAWAGTCGDAGFTVDKTVFDGAKVITYDAVDGYAAGACVGPQINPDGSRRCQSDTLVWEGVEISPLAYSEDKIEGIIQVNAGDLEALVSRVEIDPIDPTGRLGFVIRGQAQTMNVTVAYTDGTTESFEAPATGFFGACGDQVDYFVVATGDFWIDDVLYGDASAPEPEPEPEPEPAECGDLAGLRAMVAGAGLDGGMTTSLLAKLDGAIAKDAEGKSGPAVHKLKAFTRELAAQRGKGVSEEQADAWMACAEQLMAALRG